MIKDIPVPNSLAAGTVTSSAKTLAEVIDPAQIPDDFTHADLWVKSESVLVAIDGSTPAASPEFGIGPFSASSQPSRYSTDEIKAMKLLRTGSADAEILVQFYQSNPTFSS